MQRLVSSFAGPQRTIFSGIQPTGVPHLGNFVGALRQWVKLQDEPETTKLIFSVVDLHAITTPQSPVQLAKHRREAMAALLAIGIDPKRAILFHQSAVPAHAELMWILSCTASVGYLSRMTQWKSKLSVGSDSKLEDSVVGKKLKLGLFSYPVLQAADILVHRATHVPVGQDQQQHLEFARECVTNFNHAYGPHLIFPEIINSPVRRIMSLSNPTSKMSKSDPLLRSRILITDTPDDIYTKIASALTDSVPGITLDVVGRPGISNLLQILSVFDTSRRNASDLAQEYQDASPRHFKEIVAKAVVDGLGGIRDRYLHLVDPGNKHVDEVEAEGMEKARRSAEATMQIIRASIGF